MAEVKTEEEIQSYHTRKHSEAEPGIKTVLEERGWEDARIVNRYVLEMPSGKDGSKYNIQTGGSVYELQVVRRGNRFLGYTADFSLKSTGETPWYQGDEQQASQVSPDFNFGNLEVGGEMGTNTQDGNILEVKGYRGDGFYVQVDKSGEMGDVGLHVDILPEGARFKVVYHP